MSTKYNFQSTKIEINENKCTVTKMSTRPGRRNIYWLLLTSIEIHKRFSFVFFLFSLCRTVRFYEWAFSYWINTYMYIKINKSLAPSQIYTNIVKPMKVFIKMSPQVSHYNTFTYLANKLDSLLSFLFLRLSSFTHIFTS